MVPGTESSEILVGSIILAGLGVFLLIRGVRSIKEKSPGRERFNSCWAIFTTGFAAMAFEIILIFSFQNIYGYVYEMLGLIIGVFMLGMLAGAVFSNNALIKFQSPGTTLLANEILIVVFAFILPLFIPLKALSITGFIFIAGFLTGMEFPLACRLYSGDKGRIGPTAGIIDGADLLGACLGVILTGTVFVPLLGTAKTCFLIAALNLSSALLISAGLLFPGNEKITCKLNK